MARNKFRGDAPAVAQVQEFQITGAGTAGDEVTVPISNKSVVAVVPATPTATTVADAVAAALGASEEPEFKEVVWTTDGVDVVIGTSETPGRPFVIGTIAVTGTVTVGAVSITTASKGPNHWDDANNWSLGAVPVSTNDVDLQDCAVDIRYGLAQSAVTLASFNIHSTYTGRIGLTPQEGTYFQYRATELAISATTITIGAGDGSGSPMIRLNTGSVQTALNVMGTSTAGLQGQPALWWRGTHASNTMTVTRGAVGVAYSYGDVATLTTLFVGSRGGSADALVYTGVGLTLATLTQTSGTLAFEGTCTTITLDGGTLTATGPSIAVTTLTARGGTFNFDGLGTITTAQFGTGALLDLSRDPRTGKTFTNITLYAKSGIKDPNKSGTFTNGLVLKCEIDEVQPHDLGDLLTLTRS